MGLEVEKAFGRKNFMEIYAVFSTPLEFEVIGTVEWEFLEKLLEENSSFYLSGRAWTGGNINNTLRTVLMHEFSNSNYGIKVSRKRIGSIFSYQDRLTLALLA
ncbi:MAG: hypothetical protein B6229_04665 [Spirochaetaceae bacterium 4572_7]|nr:MAG: hypothetical protein B6229_04665 [Spirochaetaceae bacterium 4572_7]